jgi:hypothetical protein
MRSAMIAWSTGWSVSTPSMTMTSVPAPSIERAHLVEHRAELFDLGLARGVREARAALGERGGAHEVLGAQ